MVWSITAEADPIFVYPWRVVYAFLWVYALCVLIVVAPFVTFNIRPWAELVKAPAEGVRVLSLHGVTRAANPLSFKAGGVS